MTHLPTLSSARDNAPVNSTVSTSSRIADGAGVLGAVLAALCCAGAPIILSVLGTLGLTFLRKDAILLPFMALALLIALWAFWKGWKMNGSPGPLLLAVAGAFALVAGVVFAHGFPAKQLIGVGAVGLVAATVWNAFVRRACSSATSIGRSAI